MALTPLFRQLLDDEWFGFPVHHHHPVQSRDVYQFSPKVDVVEEKDRYKIVAELPGMDKADVNIKIENDSLVISGEKKQEKVEEDEQKHYKRIERVYGSFSRQFRLPENVDRNGISAGFENGLLRIELRKKEPEAEKAINIEIH
jgi:HSP20 family protein